MLKLVAEQKVYLQIFRQSTIKKLLVKENRKRRTNVVREVIESVWDFVMTNTLKKDDESMIFESHSNERRIN